MRTITFTKQESFLKGVKNPTVVKYDEMGVEESSSPYKKKSAPRSKHTIRPKFDTSKGKWDLDIEQKELNEIVKAMGIYDKKGNHITEAPLSSMSAYFWQTEESQVRIDSGTVSFDENSPRGKYISAFLSRDMRFKDHGEKINPAIKDAVYFTIGKVGQEESESTSKANDMMKAFEMFQNLDFDKKLKIVKAWGISSENPDPEVIDDIIKTRITVKANDRPRRGAPKFLESFISLAKMGTADIEIKGLIKEARNFNVIEKAGPSKYLFEGVSLGRKESEIETFLKQKDNSDIYLSIKKQVKLKKADKSSK